MWILSEKEVKHWVIKVDQQIKQVFILQGLDNIWK